MKPWKFAILLVFAMTTLPSHAQNSLKDYVEAHNAARAEVGVGPMKWNSTLEAYAINYANQRAGDCQLIHSQGPYGENIYIGYGNGYSDGIDAVRYWYNEKPYYDYGSNQCLGGVDCLHYTQMVWGSSVQLGCARVQCDGSGGQYFITCNYDPPGNVEGETPY
ncbi:pathogenesis-related protein PRB1-2-like [Elaeis guineensis]|uniref:Pathogenesis-related protein PRB1-2-like n=1 Tax=Elaeis guineensis var. tenera TaxID=51953 RepID=A0A6I9S9E7_ELAGV|nr:pathogenesis-related protein PRB1-2-like [Elaeis guineensis]